MALVIAIVVGCVLVGCVIGALSERTRLKRITDARAWEAEQAHQEAEQARQEAEEARHEAKSARAALRKATDELHEIEFRASFERLEVTDDVED